VQRSVQPLVGVEPLGGQGLGSVLAAAEQIDIALLGHLLVGAHLDGLDRNPADERPAGQDQHVAPVAVGGEQVRVEPDDPQGGLGLGAVGGPVAVAS
jgi:hypothetical protein